MMKKLSFKDYNKRITNRDNGTVQSHNQKESKLNSTINDVMCLFKDGSSLTINKLSFYTSFCFHALEYKKFLQELKESLLIMRGEINHL